MRRTDGFLKKKNLRIRCPVCGQTAEYTPYEYMGEVVVCKHCGTGMTWPRIFPTLGEADRLRILQDPLMRAFVKSSQGEET